MLHGFSDSLLRRLLQISLINCVTDNKHVIDADTNEEEGDQSVNTSLLTSTDEHETESARVREHDTDETGQGDEATAVHR